MFKEINESTKKIIQDSNGMKAFIYKRSGDFIYIESQKQSSGGVL